MSTAVDGRGEVLPGDDCPSTAAVFVDEGLSIWSGCRWSGSGVSTSRKVRFAKRTGGPTALARGREMNCYRAIDARRQQVTLGPRFLFGLGSWLRHDERVAFPKPSHRKGAIHDPPATAHARR